MQKIWAGPTVWATHTLCIRLQQLMSQSLQRCVCVGGWGASHPLIWRSMLHVWMLSVLYHCAVYAACQWGLPLSFPLQPSPPHLQRFLEPVRLQIQHMRIPHPPLVVAKWFHSQLLTNSKCSRKELYIPGWKIPDCQLLVEFAGSGEYVRSKHRVYR